MRKMQFPLKREFFQHIITPGILTLSLLFFMVPSLDAASYFWKGKDNTDWNTLNNWELGSGATPGALPGGGDVVTIDGTGGVNSVPVLANDVTVGTLTITESVSTSSGLNLGGFTLTASSINLGTSGSPIPNSLISNGKFDVSGNVNIAGPTLTDVPTIEGGNFPTLRDATFTTDISFLKTGGGNMGTPGDGNTYQGNFSFNNSGTGNVRFGRNAANTYLGTIVTLTNGATGGNLTFGENFVANISMGSLSIVNISSNDFSIGASGGGATVSGTIGLFATAGDIIFRNATEGGSGFILVTAASFEADNCVFNGGTSVTTSGSIASLDGSSFNGSTNSFTAGTTIGSVSGSTFGTLGGGGTTTFSNGVTSNTPWAGGNAFNTDVSFIRTGASGSNWRLDASSANTFGSAGNPVNVVINNGAGSGDLSFAQQGVTFFGDLTVTGNADNAGGAVTLAGTSGAQTITGSNDGWTFPSLIVSNTSGASINFSISITSALNLSGILGVPTSKTITLGGSATFSGGSSGYISGGALQKLGNTATNSSPSFTFHVGADGFYAPFAYSTSNSGGNPEVTVRYSRPGPGPSSPPMPLELVSQTEQWLLTVANTTISNTVVTLPYGVQSGLIGDESDLRVAFSDDGGGSWNNLGGAAGGGTISGSAQSYATGGTYIVTLASIDAAVTPLPVELMYFKAEAQDAQVRLSWATATEVNNDYFQVERSADGMKFEAIGNSIKGGGTTTEPLQYEYIDRAPLPGFSYYRLKQVDFNGQTDYSDVVVLRMEGVANNEAIIFPNPVNDQFQVLWGGEKAIDRIRLLDAKGQELAVDAIIDNKQAKVEIQTLPPGVYFLELLSGQERKIERIVIQ